MTKKSTKKQKLGEASPAKEVLASFRSNDGSATLKLLKADQPACDALHKPCKSNNKGNPNCLCDLIPREGGFRKKGVWQKDKTYLNALGPDPTENEREVSAVFARCEAPLSHAHQKQQQRTQRAPKFTLAASLDRLAQRIAAVRRV